MIEEITKIVKKLGGFLIMLSVIYTLYLINITLIQEQSIGAINMKWLFGLLFSTLLFVLTYKYLKEDKKGLK